MTLRSTLVSLLVLVCGALVSTATPAAASTRFPSTGDVVTIVVSSDREWNEQLVWFDANNRLRRQSDVRLSRHDDANGLWSATLTLVSRSRVQNVDVTFGSAGRFARCEIWVGEVRVRDDSARGAHALATCDRPLSRRDS
ncbi:hypothetical protein LK459_01820 [Gordonia otitidis]|uniref:hypothetical protein n=1 Tax=Gordonia otitidis TaxID=249058 RepID=UPI001D13C895|nr:hypothetical protein [Gordonia otitidis]UEA59659.1 hypothetical protein LK459_01820 [Gordonia otitidis]